MRKFCIIAILMFVLIGCEKSIEIPRQEIGFASQVSRSVVDETADLYESGITLFGTVSLDNDEIIPLFDAEEPEELYYSSSVGDWCYDNTKYWVPQAVHRFCALWPYDTNRNCSFTYTDQLATVSFNHTTSASGADLLYTTVTRDLVNSEDYSPVSLSFHHACAALQFNIINASNTDISEVKDIYLVGLYNSGTFSFSTDGTAGWVLDNPPVASSDTFGGTKLTNLQIDINKKHSLYSDGAILVLPQNIANTDVAFHVTITRSGSNTAEEKTIKLGKLGGSTPVKWEAGKKYEYTMTVKEDEIVSNVSVIPWVDHYVDL